MYLEVELARELIDKDHDTYAVPANDGAHEFMNKDREIPTTVVDYPAPR